MNILTFDIEEWYIEKAFHGARKEQYMLFDNYLGQILDVLDDRKFWATFFCLGKMASDFPDVIKRIAARGHEIGCHSDKHVWLNKMSYEEVDEDTRIAIDNLEQCIGKKIKGYRAPAFSVGERNKWVFEILSKYGIEYDASIYPAARDFGGFPSFGQHRSPVMISYESMELKEFPVCMIKLMGKEMAYSGGGYFRMFPLWFVKHHIEKSDYAMTYFHIGDLLPAPKRMMSKEDYEIYFKENGTWLKRYKRYVKSSIGKGGAFGKMKQLIDTMDFVSLEQADEKIVWDCQPKVSL